MSTGIQMLYLKHYFGRPENLLPGWRTPFQVRP
jgi:hypothetical protein